MNKDPLIKMVLGCWDLVTTYSWASKSTYNPPNWPYVSYHNYELGYKPN